MGYDKTGCQDSSAFKMTGMRFYLMFSFDNFLIYLLYTAVDK